MGRLDRSCFVTRFGVGLPRVGFWGFVWGVVGLMRGLGWMDGWVGGFMGWFVAGSSWGDSWGYLRGVGMGDGGFDYCRNGIHSSTEREIDGFEHSIYQQAGEYTTYHGGK